MKLTLLMMLVCLGPLRVLAQECAQKPAETSSAAQPAPAPGHRLDPNDVAILTGHAPGPTVRSAYAAPMVMYDYTSPYSYGHGQRFGFSGFFFPQHSGVPFGFFGSPFGPFSFAGSRGGH